MIKKCYVVELSSDLESLFDFLNDYGIDYECDFLCGVPGYMEITLDCVEGELVFIERQFAPYV